MTINKNYSRLIIISCLILFAALSRLLPNAIPNFSPIAAIALFGGALFANKKMAFIFPLAAMLLSDVALELLHPGSGFHNTIGFVYVSFALTCLIGLSIAKNLTPGKVLFGALASSVLFFVITNFGSWIMPFNGVYTYPQTFTGLMESFAAGVPFYRNTLIGDLFYTTVLFGGYYLLQYKLPVTQKVKARN